MAFAITHLWPGGTQEQYDATIAVVHPNGGADLPKGSCSTPLAPAKVAT